MRWSRSTLMKQLPLAFLDWPTYGCRKRAWLLEKQRSRVSRLHNGINNICGYNKACRIHRRFFNSTSIARVFLFLLVFNFCFFVFFLLFSAAFRSCIRRRFGMLVIHAWTFVKKMSSEPSPRVNCRLSNLTKRADLGISITQCTIIADATVDRTVTQR